MNNGRGSPPSRHGRNTETAIWAWEFAQSDILKSGLGASRRIERRENEPDWKYPSENPDDRPIQDENEPLHKTARRLNGGRYALQYRFGALCLAHRASERPKVMQNYSLD